VQGSTVIGLKDEYNRINRILKKDVIILIQIRLIIILMMAIYGYLYTLNVDQVVSLLPSTVRTLSNFTSAFLIVIFLIPRYLDKLETEQRLKQQNIQMKRRDDYVITAFLFLSITYYISWLLVFIFLRQVVFLPLGI
jgi:hypothetical protein